ncbi:MAG: hypothetical protein ACU0GG_21935 [Paracoccaceae bacterium]
MTIDFHPTRSGESPPLARLSEQAVDNLNTALRRNGISITIDPYGDTKLLDTQVREVLGLPSNHLDVGTRSEIEKLSQLEVVYAVGD